jgi:hypothetical protein
MIPEAFDMTKKARWGMAPLAALLASVAVAGCGDSTAVGNPQSVALNFKVTSAAAPQLASANGPALATGPNLVAGPSMTIDGSNGSLTIEEIRLIISEVELEGDEGSCEDAVPAADQCADFEAPPRFLDLPLDGEPIEAFVGLIPPGTYEELEFKIEDLEDDEDDSELSAQVDSLRNQILDEIPDWPRQASALVVGSFDSDSTGTVSFRVFLKAEIEIERELNPNLVVGDDGVANTDLTVDVRPDIWFLRQDGTVVPLQMFDYDATGELLDFELEMENGIVEVETES